MRTARPPEPSFTAIALSRAQVRGLRRSDVTRAPTYASRSARWTGGGSAESLPRATAASLDSGVEPMSLRQLLTYAHDSPEVEALSEAARAEPQRAFVSASLRPYLLAS